MRRIRNLFAIVLCANTLIACQIVGNDQPLHPRSYPDNVVVDGLGTIDNYKTSDDTGSTPADTPGRGPVVGANFDYDVDEVPDAALRDKIGTMSDVAVEGSVSTEISINAGNVETEIGKDNIFLDVEANSMTDSQIGNFGHAKNPQPAFDDNDDKWKPLAGSKTLPDQGPVRNFLVGWEAPRKGYGAYGYLVMPNRNPGERANRRQALLGLLCSFPLATNTISPSTERRFYSVIYAFIKKEYAGDELSISKTIGQDPDKFLQYYNWGRARELARSLYLDNDGIYIIVSYSHFLPESGKKNEEKNSVFYVSQDLTQLQPRLVYHYVNQLKAIVEDRAQADALESGGGSDWISIALKTVGRFVLRSASLWSEARAGSSVPDRGYDTCP